MNMKDTMIEKIKYSNRPQGIDNLDSFKALKKNWDFSYKQMTRVSSELSERIKSRNISIAVVGSYGRFEANSESDLDYIILQCDNRKEISQIHKTIKGIARDCSIKLPNPRGVFSKSIKTSDLISNMGNKADTTDSLAQRLLLLMESKPIFNKAVYDEIIHRILAKYLKLVKADPKKEAVLLLNDTIRYFRTICVNYDFTFWHENEKWTVRNIKLRHSRVVMYAGLLLLIMNASKDKKNKFAYIERNLETTPIERIVHVYKDNGDNSIDNFLKLYNLFLERLSNKNIRNKINVVYKNRYSNHYYKELKENSDNLMKELTRLVFSEKNTWTDKIFEYLIY